MRITAAATAALLLLGAPAPAGAEGLNNLWAGLNGLVVFPADPIADAIDPPRLMRQLPNAPSSHIGGFLGGTVFMVYRAFMGAMDVALAPFWFFPTLSPEARWDLVPWHEIEWD